MTRNHPEDWERLLVYLEPIHERARVSARRLSGSAAEGDDLFQEAVVRAYEELPALRQPERFAAWFYAVLLSVHRNRWRRSFWQRFLPLDAAPESGSTITVAALEGHGLHGSDAEWEQADRMSRALSTLPAVQRQAIVLHDVEGFSMEEIAGMQGVTVSAVKTRVVRGRERLRRHYGCLGMGCAAQPAKAGEAHEKT